MGVNNAGNKKALTLAHQGFRSIAVLRGRHYSVLLLAGEESPLAIEQTYDNYWILSN